ncbi:MAG: TetR/AcrR family transcriptional regulator [Paracoccaceae bacterium]
MARTTGSHSQKTGPRVTQSAQRLFAQYGYAAVSMRQIAAEVGVQVGALYNYTPDKQSLLFTLMQEHMSGLLAAWKVSQGPEKGTALQALLAFVDCHLRYHLPRSEAVFIAYMELRNLSAANFDHIEKLRKSYEDALEDIIKRGMETGEFEVVDSKIVTLAIIGMLKEVSTWYRPDGRLAETALIERYQTMACQLVGAGADL